MFKQHWRILKSGIRIHSLELADKIFKTFCALHNFLLDADDMDIPWEGSCKCDYEDKDFECYDASDVPASVHELHQKYGSLNTIDLSTVVYDNVHVFENFQTHDDENEFDRSHEKNEVSLGVIPVHDVSIREVNKLPFDHFRSKLVENFDILFQRKKLVWLRLNHRHQSL